MQLLQHQFAEAEVKVMLAQDPEREKVQSEKMAIEHSLNIASAELFLALEARQAQTAQIADRARGSLGGQAASSSSGPQEVRSGPVSFGPPIIEEVADLGETF